MTVGNDAGGTLEVQGATSRLEHLRLARIGEPQERRPRPMGGRRLTFPDYARHAGDVRERATTAIAVQKQRTAVLGIDPRLVLVFDVGGPVPQDEFARSDLQVVDSSDRTVVIAFADDPQLAGFMERLDQYGGGPVGDMAGAPYQGFFDSIRSVRRYGPEDRVSERLAAQIADAGPEDGLVVDAELWFPSDEATAGTWLDEVEQAVRRVSGDVLDRYLNGAVGVAVLRARVPARSVADLAQIDLIAVLDGKPSPAIEVGEALELDVEALPSFPPPREDAPLVAIIDSGVSSAHPLLAGCVYDAVSLPDELPDGSDRHGHGTAIASLVLHGSIERLLESEISVPPLCRVLSVRVLNEDNEFTDVTMWAHEIERAVRYCAERGARIVNLSLGDRDTPFTGPRSTPVAAVIDQLVRELELVAIVPTGNVELIQYGTIDDQFVTTYPAELLNHNRTSMLDPAPAALALTVGALVELSGNVPLSRRPIGEPGWPSPFTRHGPGIEDSVKPEVAARGGTLAIDLDSQTLVREPGAMLVAADGSPRPGVILSSHIGTSFAVPHVARVAAAIWGRYAWMTPNLVRALLLQATRDQPPDFLALGEGLGAARRAQQGRALTGYGEARLDEAVFSNDHRAVLYAEDAIPVDGVHLYEVPIPSSFFESGGQREVTISLCYDPPIRSRRLDYTASRMKFELVRGVDPEEVVALFIAASDEEEADDDELPGEEDETNEDQSEGSRTRLSDLTAKERPRLEPSTQKRSAGTNQLGRRTFFHAMKKEDGTSFLLVIQNTNRWAPAGSLQRYAVAVALRRTEQHAEIYAELEAELRLRAEAEARLRAEVQG